MSLVPAVQVPHYSDLHFEVDSPKFSQAKCATSDPAKLPELTEIFFPEGRSQITRNVPLARAICFSCIHKTECAEDAIAKEDDWGIRGGLTGEERKEIRDGRLREQGIEPSLSPYIRKPKWFPKGENEYNLHQEGYNLYQIAKMVGISYQAVSTRVRSWKRHLARLEAVSE